MILKETDKEKAEINCNLFKHQDEKSPLILIFT